MPPPPPPLPAKGHRRQSSVRINPVPTFLGQGRYNERATRQCDYDTGREHRSELEARDIPSRNHRQARLVPPPRSTRLPKPEYQKPLPGPPVEPTPLDHVIQKHHGTTSNLDYLPHRLRISKQQAAATPMERIHDLTRENGYLREELAMYKDTRTALRDLQEKTKQAHQILHNALQDLSRRLARSEKRLLDYWGVNIDGTSEEATIF